MTDDDDLPLYPLIGFNVGAVGDAITLRLEYATDRAEYEAQDGLEQQFVMSPAAAVEIGRALLRLGEEAESQGGRAH